MMPPRRVLLDACVALADRERAMVVAMLLSFRKSRRRIVRLWQARVDFPRFGAAINLSDHAPVKGRPGWGTRKPVLIRQVVKNQRQKWRRATPRTLVHDLRRNNFRFCRFSPVFSWVSAHLTSQIPRQLCDCCPFHTGLIIHSLWLVSVWSGWLVAHRNPGPCAKKRSVKRCLVGHIRIPDRLPPLRH